MKFDIPQGAPTTTHKLTIMGHPETTLYVHLGRNDSGQLRHVRIDGISQLKDDTKAYLEILWRMANSLIECGKWTAAELIEAWRGTWTFPVGLCPELGDGVIVKGPVDAIARLIEKAEMVVENERLRRERGEVEA